MSRRKLPVVNNRTESKLRLLKDGGFRMTKVRRAIIETLADHLAPRSAIQLLEDLKDKNLPVNKSTVYREIDFLLLNQIILELDLLDGMKRYELLDEGHHHHHLVCTKCSSIQCVGMKDDLNTIEKDLQNRFQFTVHRHVLEFFGVCASCTAR